MGIQTTAGEGLRAYYKSKIEASGPCRRVVAQGPVGDSGGGTRTQPTPIPWWIQALEVEIRDKQHNLRRMEAQRNELNNKGERAAAALGAVQEWALQRARPAAAAPADTVPLQAASCCLAVRALREELQLLQEPGSYVGEVIKVRRTGGRAGGRAAPGSVEDVSVGDFRSIRCQLLWHLHGRCGAIFMEGFRLPSRAAAPLPSAHAPPCATRPSALSSPSPSVFGPYTV